MLSAAFSHLPSLTAFTSVRLHRVSSLARLLLLSFLFCLFVVVPHSVISRLVTVSSLFFLCLHTDGSLVSCHTIKPSTALAPDLFCLCSLQTLHFQSSLFIISSKNLRRICKGRRLYLREEKASHPEMSSLKASIPLAGSRRDPGTRQKGVLLREC